MEIRSYDFGDMPDEKVEWVWRGYIARGSVTVLAAPPKAGKSTMLFHFLAALQQSQPFLGLDTVKQKTLLFTEESLSLLNHRRSLLGNMDIHAVPLQPGLSWPMVVGFAKLKAQAGYNLIVVDTVSRFWDVHDEGNAIEILRAVNPILTVSRLTGAALLLIHHTRKSGGAEGNAIRGSNALLGSADIGMELTRITRWDKGPRRRLEALSRYPDTPDTLYMELTEDGYVASDSEVAPLEQTVMTIVTMEGMATADDLAESAGVALRTAQRTLSEMAARGILDRTGTGGPRSPFRFSLAGAPS